MHMRTVCPVCDGPAPMLDVVDFNKSCEEIRGRFLPLSGRPVYYHRCAPCGHVFAPEFQQWADDDFRQHIYNDGYADVDPDYRERRPVSNLALLKRYFAGQAGSIRHLDYGGGNGRLSELLCAEGWDSRTHDPFSGGPTDPAALGQFNLITAFEVFEHVPDLNRLMRTLTQLIDTPGLILFSTLTSDNHIRPNERLSWWYAAPRNGHITLFSIRSLALLGQKHGLAFGSMGVGYHCFMNQFPSWAEAMTR